MDEVSTPAALSRRTLAKAMVATAVVGLHAGTGRWVVSADGGAGDPFDRIPDLDGTLLLDDATLTEYAQDFGQIISERPLAVLRPGSVGDVSRMLRFARRHGLRIVSRGRAHTTFGQSQHLAGIVFDLTTFDEIGPIDGDLLTVGAGCRWSAVLDHTLASGLMPVVLPDYIGQTVGGTLSVGGIGAMSFRDGAQVDHVVELHAVTGNGHEVRCSPDRHRELFEMLLAGQGQVGVIVGATIRLVPAPTTIRLYDLVYPDLDTLLADMATVIDDRRFDQMEAFVIPVGPGAWFYLLEGIAFHHHAAPPDDAALLAGLGAIAERTTTADLPFRDWSNRVPSGPSTRRNPWIDLFVPMSKAATFVGEVQSTIAPVAVGDRFNLLLIPLRSSTFTRPLFRTPVEDVAVGFDTLRSVPAGVDTASLVAYNRRLYDRCVELGGTQYPISAVELDVEDWAAHYGDQWPRLKAAKRRFDRKDVLASGPDILH